MSTTAPIPTSAQLIATLGLKPHPEGGWYCETLRVEPERPGDRSPGTAIYFLLERGQSSHWHRVDAVEVWHFHAGAPLVLRIAEPGADARETILGPNPCAGQSPQAIVPKGAWQAAASTGDWTLVSCTVSPGFRFEGFELAAAGWEPRADR